MVKYLVYFDANKMMDKIEILSEIFGCGENERQRSEILYDIAPDFFSDFGLGPPTPTRLQFKDLVLKTDCP